MGRFIEEDFLDFAGVHFILGNQSFSSSNCLVKRRIRGYPLWRMNCFLGIWRNGDVSRMNLKGDNQVLPLLRPLHVFQFGTQWGCRASNLHDYNIPRKAWAGHQIGSGLGLQCRNPSYCISITTLDGGPSALALILITFFLWFWKPIVKKNLMFNDFKLLHIHYFQIEKSQGKKIKITPHPTNQRKWLTLFPSLSFMHMYRFMCIFAKLSEYYVFVVHPTFSRSCWSGHFSTLKILMYFTFKCWLITL